MSKTTLVALAAGMGSRFGGLMQMITMALMHIKRFMTI